MYTKGFTSGSFPVRVIGPFLSETFSALAPNMKDLDVGVALAVPIEPTALDATMPQEFEQINFSRSLPFFWIAYAEELALDSGLILSVGFFLLRSQ